MGVHGGAVLVQGNSINPSQAASSIRRFGIDQSPRAWSPFVRVPFRDLVGRLGSANGS